jgi:hypothetical protein
MAYINDKRRSVRLTPEQEDWIARAMDAQSKGLPVPPRPTQTGDDGMQRLSPAYTDPRSQSIANSPIRPVRSMLDRIFSPGRADAVNQMNREYKENALTSQLGRSGQRIEQDYNKARTESMMTSNKMEELKRRALVDGDPKALKLLKAYTAAIGKGGGLDYGMLGVNKTVDGLVPARKGGDTPKPPPSGPVLSGQLTLSEAREKATSVIAELQRKLEMLDAEEADINTEGSTRSIPSYATGGSHPGAAPQPSGTRDIPINMAWRARRTKEIPAERAAMQQEIQQLEQVLTEISGPLTSPGGPEMGSPNRSTVDR